MKFRSKPTIVEAFRYNIDSRPDWFQDEVSKNLILTADTHCTIRTLEGNMCARKGDWIIQGVKGEIYPCKPDIFEIRWETVE